MATVNSTTGGDQTEPVITALADGRVFVAWTDASGTEGVGGGGTAVRGRVFDVDPAGALVPAGGDFLVNTYTAGDQSEPAIATTSDGLVAVAWTSESGVLDTDSSGISMQLFDPRLPADAKVGPSGRVCFAVAGAPGDLAVVNLTPVEADGLGNGQLVSSDVVSPPVASNVNFSPGSFDPNVAVAPIGADGEVCFVNSVHASVHLVADHLGTIDAAAFTLASGSGAPLRVVDTRVGQGGSTVAPSGRLCFAVAGAAGGVAVVNLTPVNAAGFGNGQLVSSDVVSPPVASNVNFSPGSFDPNVALAPIGADGRVCFVNSVHASVDLVADHLGTIDAAAFGVPSGSGAPLRVVDTRVGQGGSTVAPSGRLCFAVAGAAGGVAVVNLTPVNAGGFGNGQLVSSDVVSPPVASNVNFSPGSFDPNVGFAPIGADNRVCYVNSLHATVDLVADHLGTIAATSYTPASPSGAPARVLDTRPLVLGANLLATTQVRMGAVDCVDATWCVAAYQEPQVPIAPDFITPSGVTRLQRSNGVWDPIVVTGGISLVGRFVGDIECTGADVCIVAWSTFAASGGGFIASTVDRTTDGGVSWQSAASGLTRISDLECVSGSTCVAVGAGTTRSIDGGVTWSPVTMPSGVSTVDVVDCPSASVCYAAAAGWFGADTAALLRSTDAGTTWSTANTFDGPVLGLDCVSLDTCTATTRTPELVRTTDGGATLSTTLLPTTQYPVAFECRPTRYCLGAAAYSGPVEIGYPSTVRLLLSRDGGATWEPVVAPTGLPATVTAAFTDVSCHTDTECVVAGSTTVTTGGFVTAVPLPP